eukprot:jgi/Hompol1/133/HPOL_002935-RA
MFAAEQRGAREERDGRLADALRLYRRALRLDHNVEANFRKLALHRSSVAELNKAKQIQPPHPHPHPHSLPHIQPQSHQNQSQNQNQNQSLVHRNAIAEERDDVPAASLQPIVDLVAHIEAQHPVFIEATDSHESHDKHSFSKLAWLPGEIITGIMQWVILSDIRMTINLSLVCKRMFLLVREQSLWRFQCQQVYNAGRYLTLDDWRDRYGGSWRDVWMDKPRIRVDGVYISKVNYMRRGYTEGAFNQPVHIVQYFRYLRFYGSNQFIMLTSTASPNDVVRDFGPNYDCSDIMYGSWGLSYINNSILKVGQNVRGRQNKLHWIQYSSVRPNDPSSRYEFPKDQLKQFTFSRVKFSEAAQLPN